MAIIESINIGTVGKLSADSGKVYDTGIFKKPVSEPQTLKIFGLPGDAVMDRRFHGGVDKALCVYFSDNFPHLKTALGLSCSAGSFGENLTISGLDEKRIHIGDSFKIGTAEIQCTEPRQPCFKLARVHESSELISFLHETGFTGAYFRVLKEGQVSPGDELELIQSHAGKFSIAKANRLLYKDKKDNALIEEILSIKELSSTLRKHFQGKFDKKHSAL
jgi:MOSC domain-containing protein YiiM